MGTRHHPVSGSVLGAIEQAQSTAEELRDECQEAVDSMPENLQSGSRAEALQEAVDALDTLADFVPSDCPEVVQDLPARWTEDTRQRAQSRRGRRDNATSAGQAASAAISEWLDENDEHEEADEVRQFMDELDDALSQADDADFPGMMG